jgi:protease-4
MIKFFKYLFASTIGTLLGLFLFFILSFSVLTILISQSESELKLKKDAVFNLKLDGQVVERANNDLYATLFNSNKNTTIIGLDEVLECIKKAKQTPEIKGIFLESNILSVGVSSAQEIREALLDFKNSGKFVVANSGTYTQNMYYLSSVADKIILNPSGLVELKGLSSSPVFYKNALEKLGVEMQVVKVGTYKSFAEQYTNTSMSEENRSQVSSLLTSMWDVMLRDIAFSRNVSKEQLNAYADELMTFQLAEKNEEYGLVDTLLYQDQAKNLLTSMLGLDSQDDWEVITLADMKKVPDTKKQYVSEKIAIVYATGAIDDASSIDNDGINSSKLIETLEKIRKDENVKAVVLRVNSPGGSAYGSEQIWRAVTLMKEQKPIIVSMGDYAASGGYYIACAADCIVAQPTTLTGSIGIFGIIPNVKGLTDKLGISFDMVKTNEMSDMPSLNRPFSEKEKSLMQLYINHGYDLFVKRCAEGRKLSKDSLNALAQGRVWTGMQAQKIGLVDELGSLEKAIEIAAKKAKIEKYRRVDYPEKKDMFTQWMEDISVDMQTSWLKFQLGDSYQHVMHLKKINQSPQIQAYMPFLIDVK